MATVTRTITPANPYAPRVARLRALHGTKGRRSIDTTDPDAMLKELVLRAIDRFEEACDFAALGSPRE